MKNEMENGCSYGEDFSASCCCLSVGARRRKKGEGNECIVGLR